jgi:hypothetical protein
MSKSGELVLIFDRQSRATILHPVFAALVTDAGRGWEHSVLYAIVADIGPDRLIASVTHVDGAPGVPRMTASEAVIALARLRGQFGP